MEINFKYIFEDEKIAKYIIKYLRKEDILNLSFCSKNINFKINERNHLLIEIIGTSRTP